MDTMELDVMSRCRRATAAARAQQDVSIGRIVSVTGAKAIVLLDGGQVERRQVAAAAHRSGPRWARCLPSTPTNTVVLAIVSALSVPVPAQREGESELWIAELGLVGELWQAGDGRAATFNRGVSVYPALGDRVRVASRQELEQAFCGDRRNSVRVGCIRQDPSISGHRSASTNCSASISPSSAPPAPASPARRR